jgi:hypothetical protein
MGLKIAVSERDLFQHPLCEQINLKHPLARLADLINGDGLNASMGASFVSRKGRPPHHRGSVLVCCISSMRSISRTRKWSGNGWRILIGRSSLAKRFCRLSRRLIRRACPADASVWEKPESRNYWPRRSKWRSAQA